MSPEEILAELRDLHLPPAPEAGVVGFAWEPLIGVSALALLAIAARLWRRGAWRRAARARLAAAAGEPNRLRRLAETTRLLGDLGRIGRVGRAPDCAHLPPERIGPAEEARLRAHLAAALRGRASR
ncbi:MAG: DUF4381 family protein [Paracoccaceae bacterium]